MRVPCFLINRTLCFLIAALVLCALPLKGLAASGDNYRGSVFGIFSSHGTQTVFSSDMGLTEEEYYEWVDGHMENLGAHWTRMNLLFNWGMVEQVVGDGYDWNANGIETDRKISAIYEPPNEINLLAVIQPLRDDGITPISNPDEFAAFVAAIAERYDGDGVDDMDPNVRIDYFQLSNEVLEWYDIIGLNAAEYAQTAELTLDALRSANPNARLMLVGQGSTSTLLTETMDTIEACVARGVDFNAVDLHWWGGENDWGASVVTRMRSYLDSLGAYDVEIWSNENGTYVGCPTGRDLQDEEGQARSLVKRIVWGRGNGLDRYFWNAIVDWYSYEGNTDSFFTAVGLVGNGRGSCDPTGLNQERLAYYSYKLLAGYTDTLYATHEGAFDTGSSEIEGYAYRRLEDGAGIYIMWSTNGQQMASFKTNVNAARIINLIPDSSGSISERIYSTMEGQVNLRVGEDPLMVIEETDTSFTETQANGKGGGSGCFIATAAFGGESAAEIAALRRFRDAFLIKSKAGRAFVRAYYRFSPPLAGHIERHPGLAVGVRILLYPVVWVCGAALWMGPVWSFVFLISALTCAALFFAQLMKRRQRLRSL